MVEKDVLEHLLGHAGRVECPRHAFAHEQGLRRVFQKHSVAGDEGGSHGVDRGHVGVVPGCDDKNDAVGHAPDEAAEPFVVGHLDIGQRIFRDPAHVNRALLETAELAAVAHRPAHLPGEFGDDLVVHRPHGGDPGEHEVDALAKRARGPDGLRVLRACRRLAGGVRGERVAFDDDRSVDRRDAAQYCHGQALSKPRATSQSVTTRSYSSCSTSAQRT